MWYLGRDEHGASFSPDVLDGDFSPSILLGYVRRVCLVGDSCAREELLKLVAQVRWMVVCFENPYARSGGVLYLGKEFRNF